MRELGVGKERDEAAPRWAARLRRNGGEQGGARLARVFATAKELRRRESFVQQGALRLGALEGKTALGPIVCHQDSPVRCRAASRECGERRGAIFKGQGAGGGHAAARPDVTQPRVRDRKSGGEG